MTLAFFALKRTCRFICRITFHNVLILQLISCRIAWIDKYIRGVKGKEVILRIMFCLESFQMIANGVSKFLLFTLRLTIARLTSFI